MIFELNGITFALSRVQAADRPVFITAVRVAESVRTEIDKCIINLIRPSTQMGALRRFQAADRPVSMTAIRVFYLV